ncbi:DUF2255 family protein [Microbacterium sp. PMB16]|uniref:DUF2255 family protein n=1 Tax=Microbacterium sp. PMB16 TaxID=3120157 RepID=UPI003F4BD93E
MSHWSATDIRRIAATDDLHIAPFRADGTTYGTLTWIWSVVVDDRLFVRAWNGTNSRWYKSAMSQRSGRISAAESLFEVDFAPAEASVRDAVDAAYRNKYAGSSYLPPMLKAGPQAATVEITPRVAASADEE